MSYILDALKKAEQKRPRGELPDLQAVTSPPVSVGRTPVGALWKKLLVLAMLGNALVILWYGGFMREDPSAPLKANPGGAALVEAGEKKNGEGRGETEKDAPSALAQQRPSTAGDRLAADGDAQVEARNVRQHLESPRVIKEKRTPPSVVKPAATAGQVHVLEKLPASVQSAIPKMTMALHFYSSDAAARMVRINGRNLREGDWLTEGVQLAEITPQGIVFASRGYRFEVPDLRIGSR